MAENANTNDGSGGHEIKNKLDNVRRRLDFGVESCPITASEKSEVILVDENEVQQYFKKQTENAIIKWNFDFINDRPLPGDWEWEKVQVTNHPGCRQLTSEMKEKNQKDNRNI